MGGWQVRIVRTKGLAQKYHVRLESAVPPFEILLWSEKYRDHDHAWKLGNELARAIGCELIEAED